MLFSIFGTGSPSLLHLQQQANEAIMHKQPAARNPGVGMSDVTAVCCVTTWWCSCICSAEGMTTHKPLPVLYSFVCQPEKGTGVHVWSGHLLTVESCQVYSLLCHKT